MDKEERIRITVILNKSVFLRMRDLRGDIPQSRYCSAAIKEKNDSTYLAMSDKQKEDYLKRVKENKGDK
tara:strand:+ start:1087 stop:1293 length:207 start_codon:yes stop_codon:yes gene_type:complete